MLVITRRIGQEFYIGNNITVKILSFNKYGIEIGVEAPKDITVLRKEVFLRLVNKPGEMK